MSTPFTPARISRRPSLRLLWMLPAGLSLLAGLNAALLLLGLPAPVTTSRLPETHGMLLVLGFVGTLVSLERATALRRWYGYVAPGLLGLSGVLLLADPVPLGAGKFVLVLGTAAFTLLYVPLWMRRYDEQLLTQLLAAGLALTAAILWFGGVSMDATLPWLIGFVVLTIAAERVELAAITMGPRAGGRLLVHAWLTTLALIVGLANAQLGAIALGVALLALVAWLVRHDIARRTIRAKGATRFMAACMLGGYFWLVIAGVVLLLGYPGSQAAYDTVTHAVFLGYTISMIMAHATTILPAILHVALPYRPFFWVPALLLHASLIVRIWLGDGLGIPLAFTTGGVMGIIALLLFVLTAVGSAIAGPPKRRPSPAVQPDPARPEPAQPELATGDPDQTLPGKEPTNA